MGRKSPVIKSSIGAARHLDSTTGRCLVFSGYGQEIGIDGPVFFLCAAEHSGDALGAALIDALRAVYPKARFVGVGGPKMAKAGCRIMADPTRHSAMLLGAASQIGFWLRLLKQIRISLAAERPSVVIPIDSPPVNLRVARAAQDLKIPVCFYVAPQLWAWAPWRIKQVRARVDTLCCVLPFEEEYFRNRGVNAVYVGHPIFENRPAAGPVVPHLPEGNMKIALFPGSRRSEIEANLPVMLRTVIVAQGRHAGTVFAAAAADSDRLWQIRQAARKASVKIDIRTGCADEIIRWADLVLTVSGTATLQIARHHKPMIILYAVAWWKWNLAGRFLIQTRYMSLVNILAGRELVPEFMPFYGSPEPVVNRTLDLMAHANQRQEISRQLAELTDPMLTFAKARSPSQRVVDEIRKFMPRADAGGGRRLDQSPGTSVR